MKTLKDKHLGDEDISRLIEGTVTKHERADFLVHLADCDACLSVYSATTAFLEKENPHPPAGALSRLWAGMGNAISNAIGAIGTIGTTLANLFTVKKLVPVTLALLLIVPTLVFVLTPKAEDKRISYIITGINRVESNAPREFVGAADRTYAAIRAGILLEDLAVLESSESSTGSKAGQEIATTRATVIRRLRAELNRVERNIIFTDQTPAAIRRIKKALENHELSSLFQLGGFLERQILSTLSNAAPTHPSHGEIRQYLHIAATHHLPIGLTRGLNKLMDRSNTTRETRATLENIKDIFFY